jgi:hypothetical protein
MGYALRMRWEWLARTQPERIWNASCAKQELAVRAMFDASVHVQIGNGAHALFWVDKWLDGQSVADVAPELIPVIHKRRRQSRTVRDTLQSDAWISHISGSLSVSALQDFIWLWERLQHVSLVADTPDKFIWRWTADQQYSASSAYRAFFLGQCAIWGAKELSKVRALPSCKFFF